MSGTILHQAIRLPAALLSLLLLVLAPLGRVAAQAAKSTTETREYKFDMTVTTAEVVDCLTVWSLTLTTQVINTDLSSGPTRTPVSVAGNVRRNNLGCSQPISQRTIVAGWQVPLSSTSINVFNVWSDAGHITLKGVADLLPFSDFSVGLTGNGRATFKIDADCAISPTDLFPATQSTATTTIDGVKRTTTTALATCAAKITSATQAPAFDPKSLLTLQFGDDLVLVWAKLASVDRVTFKYSYIKEVTMVSPKHRRILRAA
ncbi:hypothetical protein CHLRE_12g518700v5 [Chlamydomonas reinhardtii]|uniref:Pherophorin domain-containing protein n=1 Tax=Chlamydomonas reinhardtii TaxID=3055 RepID=A0A2K3D3Y2_CHLRE|nr:uncharacterized protein CHLRE_12g518700v5 [Chlamydomonas reinhardtii]PNW75240.1 hypothetical protein CHLRE_12g518700v5 [Chlamydomonas reinhardtii]